MKQKNDVVKIWAKKIKGGSAGQAPNHVSNTKFIISLQYNPRKIGLNINPLKNKNLAFILKRSKDSTDISNNTTPPSLFGTDRKIA
jgi:hypothetical protein